MRTLFKRLTSMVSASTLILGLLVGIPLSFTWPSIANAASCGVAGTGYSDTTAKIDIIPSHGKIFYVDLKQGLNAAYVGYKIVHNDNKADATINDIWVKVSSFTSTGTKVVTLANEADYIQRIGNITAANASSTVFFLLKATAVSTVAQTHTVTIYKGRPDLGTSSSISTCDFSFSRVDSTIAANANKVTSITSATSTSSVTVGSTLTVTTTGLTGQGGAGDSTGDKDVMWVSPASNASWPTRALRLESTSINVKRTGTGGGTTYTDTLFIPDINKSGSNYTSKTTYTATYTFRVIGSAPTNPSIKPVAQIASGTQMKHTGSYPSTIPTASLSTVTVPLTVTKSASTTAYTPTACTSTYVATRYTIVARVNSGTIGEIELDQIVDEPSTGMIIDSQASQVTVKDVNSPTTARTLIAPGTISGESPTKYYFVGPFVADGTVPVTLSYTMCVLKTSGTYTNKAYATVGGTIVGSNSTSVSQTSVTTNGTGITSSSTSNVAKAKLAQTITFDSLPTVGVGSVTTLIGSSTSGLSVTFSTSSTICSVALNNSTGFYEVTANSASGASSCVINADQAGNADYDPATRVSRTLNIIDGQTITLSSTTSMSTTTSSATSTQTFTAISYKQSSPSDPTGLTVTLTSMTKDICTVAQEASPANTFKVTVLLSATGNCILNADQAGGIGTGSITYAAAATVERTIIVGAQQTIAFNSISSQYSTTESVSGTAANSVTVTATSVQAGTTTNTNLTVDIATSTPDVCTVGTETISSGVTSAVVTKNTTGECVLSGSQLGNATYAPATDIQTSFTIGAPQTITFNKPTDVPKSNATRTITATTDSGLQVTFTSLDTAVCDVATSPAPSLSGSTTTATITLKNGGACDLKASSGATTRFYAAPDVIQTFTITGATSQTITYSRADTNISAGTVTLNGTASSGLPVSYSSSTTSVCTVSDVVVTLKVVGTCTIVASQSGDVTYAAAANVTDDFVIFAKPTISFTQGNVALSASPVTLTSTLTYTSSTGSTAAGQPVTYTGSTNSVCTVSGSTLTLVTGGTCTIVASYAGNGSTFLAADSVTQSFTVTLTQTITFNTPANTVYSASTYSISASTTSSLLITFTPVDSTVCTVATGNLSGSTTTAAVTLKKVGSCAITASQAGDATYPAATSVSRTFSITPKELTVNVTAANKSYSANTNATVTVDTGSLSGVINGDTVSIDTSKVTGVFSSSNVGDGITVILTVASGVLTGTHAGNYTLAAPTNPTANITAVSVQITASSPSVNYGDAVPTVTPTFANSFVGGQTSSVLNVQPTCSTTYAVTTAVAATAPTTSCSGASATNYTFTYVPGTVTINRKTVTITADSLNVVQGETLATITYTANGSQLRNGDSVSVFSGITCTTNYATTDTAGATGKYTRCSGGTSDNYIANYVDGTVTVTAMGVQNQTITFASISNRSYSPNPFDVKPTASSTLTVSLTSTTTDVCTVGAIDGSGNFAITMLKAGICSLTASQAGGTVPGGATYNAAPNASQSFTINKSTRTIEIKAKDATYTTSYESTYATWGATAPTLQSLAEHDDTDPKTYALDTGSTGCSVTTDGAVTFTGAGTCKVKVSISNGRKYDDATSATVSFTMGKKPQTITLTGPASMTYGDADQDITATTDGSGLTPTMTVATVSASICEIVSNKIRIKSAGDCVIESTRSGNADYENASPTSRTFNIAKKNHTITYAVSDVSLGASDQLLTGLTSADQEITYTVDNSSLCEIVTSGGNKYVKAKATGTCNVTASSPGSTNFNSATGTLTRGFVISAAAKLNRTIDLTNSEFGGTGVWSLSSWGESAKTLTSLATDADADAKTYSTSTPSTICEVSTSGVITPKGAGDCVVQVSIASGATHNAANSSTKIIRIGKKDHIISYTVSDVSVGATDQTLATGTSENQEITYTVNDTSICEIVGIAPNFKVKAKAAGTCTVTGTSASSSNYNAATLTRGFVISAAAKLNRTININNAEFDGSGVWSLPNWGESAKTLESLATAADTDSKTYSTSSSSSICEVSSSGVVTPKGAGDCVVQVNIASGSTHNAATSSTKIVRIGKKDHSINFTVLSTQTVGDADQTLPTATDQSQPINYTVNDTSICEIVGTAPNYKVRAKAPGTCTVTASSGSSSNFNAATGQGGVLSRSFNVNGRVVTPIPPAPTPDPEPQTPAKPENPNKPETPAPVKPETPAPVEPAKPENPNKPETPTTPVTPPVESEKPKLIPPSRPAEAVTLPAPAKPATPTPVAEQPKAPIYTAVPAVERTIPTVTTAPSETIVIRNVTVQTTPASNGVQISGNDWSIAITSTTQRQQGSANEPSSKIEIQVGNTVTTFGTGFKPNSQVDVYVYSTPIWLGSVITDDKGNYTVTLPMPASLPVGDHVFQAQGKTFDNIDRTANVPITLVPASVATKASTSFEVFYGLNSYILDAKAKAVITKAYKAVKSRLTSKSVVTVDITGWVQPTTKSPNINGLSSGRAKAVQSYLKQLGLKAKFVLKTPGHDKINAAQSRRATTVITWTNPKS